MVLELGSFVESCFVGADNSILAAADGSSAVNPVSASHLRVLPPQSMESYRGNRMYVVPPGYRTHLPAGRRCG